jgi:ATP-dependent DNA helicase RecQ
MRFDPARALALLREGTARDDAVFRDGQEEAVRHVVEARGRLLVVRRTGWGKSNVYFIATALIREAGGGPALLVSPLLSLMRNQLAAARRMGVRAATIHSDNADDWSAVEAALRRDEVDILMVSPERLANARFGERVLSRIGGRISMLVVDEAHCISDWGHDFRPHYRLVERIARTLPDGLRLLATTATANDRVLADLADVLGPGLTVSRGDLSRASLTLQTIRMPGQAERLAWLAARLAALDGHGIVYTLTVRDANRVADWLKSRGLRVEAYTGESGDRREALEQALLANELKALVATTALGMGYDKPDLAFVFHYQTPGSVVAYYQQVGRAGRALDSAYGVLLSGEEATAINDWFIDSAFPTRAEVHTLLGLLAAAPGGLSVPQLLARASLGRGRIEKTVQLLSLESPAPVVKDGTRWRRTDARLGEAFWARTERLTALRRDEQRQMQAYVDLPFGEHMAFLVRALDGDPRGLAPPALAPLPAAVDQALVREAVAFLRRAHLAIEPRLQWQPGGMPRMGTRGRIAADRRAMPGRALSEWGDGGWGMLVARGRRDDGHFDDALVDACVALVRAWAPTPAPAWVACVPSLRDPGLMPAFAGRLARALDLPFHDLLTRGEAPATRAGTETMRRAQDLDGAFALREAVSPPGPVLLVDDRVDSRWTFTVCAWLLRRGGAGAVHPLALAAGGGGS